VAHPGPVFGHEQANEDMIEIDLPLVRSTWAQAEQLLCKGDTEQTLALSPPSTSTGVHLHCVTSQPGKTSAAVAPR